MADMNVVIRVVSREIQGGGFYQLILLVIFYSRYFFLYLLYRFRFSIKLIVQNSFSCSVVARQIGDPGLLNTFSKFCNKQTTVISVIQLFSEYKFSIENN